MEEYIPFNPGQATKLERELGRLPSNKAVPIGVLGVDEQMHRPFSSERFVKLDNTTNIEEVKEALRALRPAARERKVWNPNTRASSSPSLRQSTMEGPAVEDHVRDYEYASAQLQAVRSRELCIAQEAYDRLARQPGSGQSRPPLRDQGNAYNNAWYGESNMGRVESTHIPRHGGAPPTARPGSADWQSDDFFRSSDSDIRRSGGLASSRSQPPQNPPNADVRSGYSSFFASEDDESDREDSRFSDEDLPSSGPVGGRLRPNATPAAKNLTGAGLAPRHLPSSPSRSPSPRAGTLTPPHHHIVASASVPAFANLALSHDIVASPSELSLPEHLSEMSSSPAIRRSLNDSMDSDSASHKSKDSGYDSGASFEGFEDDDGRGAQRNDGMDDDDERRRPAKVPANEDEDTGSRHQHVPETRLRTRRTVEDFQTVGGASNTLRPSESNGSLAAANSSKLAPGTPSKPPGTPAPLIAPTPIRSSARTGSIAMADESRSRSGSIQPLLPVGSSATPVKKNLRSTDEVEMTRFDIPSERAAGNGPHRHMNGQDAQNVDLVLEDSELPDFPHASHHHHQQESMEDSQVALDLESLEPAPPRTTFYHLPDPRHWNRKKAIKDLQSGFSELYRGMHLLKRYAELNVEATDKILAKYEKNIARGHRLPFMRHEISKFNFSKSQELRLLISQTEYVYAQAFTGGHRTPAMQKLRVPEEEEDMESTTLRFGLLFGMSLGFMLIIIYMTFVVQSEVVQKMRPDLVVFRMLFIATLMTWYWGVDMWIWAKHRVNYPFIFEFNSRGHMRHQNIFDIASVFTVILIGDMMLYMLSALQRYDADFVVPGFEFLRHVPPESYPLILVILLVALSIFYSFHSGFWLLRTIGRIVTAPVFKVVFRDFFLADQLVSVSLVLQDIDFTICYFATCAFRGGGNSCATNHVWMIAILSVMPQFWRLLQCFRRYRDSKDKTNLYNAGKYTAGMLVAITGSLRNVFSNRSGWLALWLVFVIIATVYSYGWDIYKDWSIGDRRSSNWMLREQLLYPKWWYYAAAFVNLFLRLMWIFTISPDAIASIFFLGKDGLTTVLTAVEVSRRAMWNIFRLENEQLNNCGRFRAVQDIPLPLPLKPAVEEGLYQDKIK